MADYDLGPAVVARVREAADLVEVVADHVRLKRRGRSWIGLCPFHEEKTPSFSVSPEKGLFFCFGCHAGGDAIDFVQRMEGVEFPEAVERLASRFSVELPPRSPEAARRHRQAEQLTELLEEAQRWFEQRLLGPEGAPARRALTGRGFSRESWSKIGFGFAPDGWRALYDELSRHALEQHLVDAGLVVRSDTSNRPYDRFRNRITFPIRAPNGRLIAFGGRALGDTEPKYLNSPEGPLFQKRATLFWLDKARPSIADTGRVLVVEGYFDCLSLYRVGISNVVATLGTSLTPEHGRRLRRIADTALLCYDADAAGRRAAAAGAEVLLEAGLTIRVVVLPEERDPDDVLRDEGVEALRSHLEGAVDLLDFLMVDAPEDTAARRAFGEDAARLVAAASDPVVRYTLQEGLARRLDLPIEVVREIGISANRRGQEMSRPGAVSTTPTGELELARILIDGPPSCRGLAVDAIDPDFLRDPAVRKLVASVRQAENLEAWCPGEASRDDDVRVLAARLAASALPPVSEENARRLIGAIARRQATEQSRRLNRSIEAARDRGDEQEMARLMTEKAQILRRWRDH